MARGGGSSVAGRFAKWQDGGAAFIERDRDPSVTTLGRMYLVTEEQFLQVLLQENGYDSFDVELGVDVRAAVDRGASTFRGGVYSALLSLGERDGHPVLTFTTDRSKNELIVQPPGPAYLETLVRGLRETYALADAEIVEYLGSAPGNAGPLPGGRPGPIGGGDLTPAPYSGAPSRDSGSSSSSSGGMGVGGRRYCLMRVM